MQSKVLGIDPALVFVRHPIQDRSDEELRALADEVFEQVIRAISAG